MGKLKYLLIGFLIFIITSCDGLLGNNIGKPIKFGIAQYPTTRTAYSQYYDGRIDWIEGDKVTIYMDWNDGSGYSNNYRESGVYEIYDIHPNDRESHGRIRYIGGEQLKWKGDFSGNDGRAHEYPHKFWSVYPPTSLVNGKFSFYLDPNQDYIDVSELSLVAYEKDVYSNTDGEGHVELHYYPMFTTLCVTINNEADLQIGNVLELSSDNYDIAGNYYVDVTNDYLAIEGGNSSTVSSDFNIGETITFFIIPREYSANELYFILGNESRPIPEAIRAGHKYNITINTKEIEVADSRMTDTEAWFLLAILKNNGGGNNCWNDFENFWKNVYGFKDINDFNNSGFWNKFNNSISTANFDEMGELLDEYFPGALLDSLLTTMSKIEDINLGEGSLASTKKMPEILSSADFSKMFPNVKTIKLMPQTDITYKFVGLESLETITLDGGYTVTVNIILEDCAEGVTINKGNNKTVTVEIINN